MRSFLSADSSRRVRRASRSPKTGPRLNRYAPGLGRRRLLRRIGELDRRRFRAWIVGLILPCLGYDARQSLLLLGSGGLTGSLADLSQRCVFELSPRA